MQDFNSNSLERMILGVLDDPHTKLPHLSVALAVKRCEGLTEKIIDCILEEIPQEIVLNTLRIDNCTSKSISEYSFSIAHYETLLGLCRIWSLLQFYFKKRKEICASWLNTPKRPLRGEKPIQLISSNAGREAVTEMLYRMETGDFS